MTLAADRPKITSDIFAAFDTTQLLLISGKGGVGKTTLSCGLARQWAARFPEERVLLISTDPAHSLGDVLLTSVEDSPLSVADLPNLQVRALDSGRLLTRFKTQHGEALQLLVERGSFVEGKDLSPVWSLSWPGLDELMGLLEIQRILREQVADRVVVDMAPSGHTLNLFGLMDFLDGFLEALDLFQEKHRCLSQSLSGQHTPDQADRFLDRMKADLVSGRALLQSSQRTACWVVAIPEPLSLLETRRFMKSLSDLQIPCGGLLLNRYQGQQNILQQFRALTSSVLVSPQLLTEPVGAQLLDNMVQQLSPRVRSQEEVTDLIVWPSKATPNLPDFIAAGRRLIIVGGKGGVGKSTVSAAIGLRLAKDHPEASIQLVSIDPAHSLGDVLETSLGHVPLAILPNLSVQEVNSALVLEEFRDEYLWELAEMISGGSPSGDLQLAYGPQAWRQIVAQALPGIDEMLSLITIMDLLERDEKNLIVLDTAPTGHLIRFLEMPMALNDWLAWIFKLWIKYQDVAGHTQLMGRLRTLRQRIVQAQKQLKDSTYTEFISVVQNQSAIVAESCRLIDRLKTMGITHNYLVHNRAEAEQPMAADLFQTQMIVRLPELPCEVPPAAQVRGAARLLF